jgi:hypothetical protein
MNRRDWVLALVVGLLSVSGLADNAVAQSALPADVENKLATAGQAVEQARAAIAKGKALIAEIPEDSAYLPEVTQMLQAASANWKLAIDSLKGATESSAKIASASNESLAGDYALLARVNADVALTGANVVQIGLAYVEAVATDKTEALDLIRGAMQDALAASSQVQFNYERVKNLISEKYSN